MRTKGGGGKLLRFKVVCFKTEQFVSRVGTSWDGFNESKKKTTDIDCNLPEHVCGLATACVVMQRTWNSEAITNIRGIRKQSGKKTFGPQREVIGKYKKVEVCVTRGETRDTPSKWKRM